MPTLDGDMPLNCSTLYSWRLTLGTCLELAHQRDEIVDILDFLETIDRISDLVRALA